MKKLVSILLGATLTFGLVGLSGCGEEPEAADPIHGFEGTFSEESYKNEQDAVQALEGEFGGEIYKIDIQKYSRESGISKSTIKTLNKSKLGADDKVVSGKKVKVTYTSTAEKTSSVAASVEEETSFSAKVFETKEDGNKRFRYYIDRADYDGMISKSYFDYLTSSELENFTYTTTASIKVQVMGEQELRSESMTIKCDGKRAFLQSGEESAYMEESDDDVKVWKKTEDGYERVTDLTLFGINLKEFFEESVAENEFETLDQSCFIPSETGIVINEGGKGLLLKQLGKEIGEGMDSYSGMLSFDGEVAFTIDTEEGLPMNYTIKMAVSASLFGVPINVEFESKNGFSDVGTTVVETPEGIE